MTAARQHGDIGRAAADVEHHGAARLADRQPGAERGRHRLGDEIDLARAERDGGVVDGAALDRRRLRRHADEDARAAEAEHRLGALDELAQHLLGGDEVGDDAVAQRPHQLDALGRAPDQRLGLAPDGEDFARAAVRAHGDGRRLIDDDAAPDHVHQRVRRAEVDRNVVRERARHALQHHRPTALRRGLFYAGPRARTDFTRFRPRTPIRCGVISASTQRRAL